MSQQKPAAKPMADKPLTDKQNALIKSIMKDGFVTSKEFKQFSSSVLEDLEVTKTEAAKITAMYKKALDDNSRDIIAMAEINQSYAATVPAKVHSDTVKEITTKFKDTFKVLALVVIVSMLLFFLASYLPDLMNLITAGTQYLLP